MAKTIAPQPPGSRLWGRPRGLPREWPGRLGTRLPRFERYQAAKRSVRPDGVVVVAVEGDLAASIVQSVKISSISSSAPRLPLDGPMKALAMVLKPVADKWFNAAARRVQ